MKRICVLLNKDFFHQTRLIREHDTLTKAGYQVSLICVADDPSKPAYEKLANGEVHRLFKKRLYKYHLFSLRLVKYFFKVLKSHPKSDFIHAHDPSTLLLGWLLAKAWGAKLVYDAHEYWDAFFDDETESLQNNPKLTDKVRAKKLRQLQLTRRFETWVLPRCDAVMAVNDTIGQRMQAKVQHQIRHYLTLRNIASYQHIPKNRKLHEHFQLPEQTKVILYQGQIAEKRGVHKAVEAMEHLSNPQTALVFIGPVLPSDKVFFEDVMRKVEESDKLRGRVFYKGFAPPDELLHWTASADLGLQPIMNWNMSYYLCLPNKTFEYIQAGLPIASSDFPELRNIIEGYNIGVLFDPDNPQQIAEQIQRYFDSPDLQKACETNLRIAKEELCWETEEQKLIELYAKLS